MYKLLSFTVTPTASAELVRQSAFAGTTGVMHIDFLEDSCMEGWFHIRVRPGKNHGVPIARVDGVTVYAPPEQIDFFQGLNLNYYADLSGGGFLISTSMGYELCSCGAGFKIKKQISD